MLRATLDASDAIVRFSPTLGIPVNVRNALRPAIIDLTQRLGAAVEANLNSGLKSRTSLTVKKEMVESQQGITGRVTTLSSKNPLLPFWLEDGTAPHVIRARNAPVLAFFWDRIGKMAYFKQVNHPGFKGIQYTARAFSDLQPEIVRRINTAVADGLGKKQSGGSRRLSGGY